jgi:hypothetical protein
VLEIGSVWVWVLLRADLLSRNYADELSLESYQINSMSELSKLKTYTPLSNGMKNDIRNRKQMRGCVVEFLCMKY